MLIIIESALHIWCSAYMDSTNHRTKIFGKSSKKKNLNFGGIGSYLHSIYNVLRVIREDLKAEEDVHRLYAKMRVFSVAQSCWTLCDPTHCSPSGSCVHGIFQARILEQVAISYSRDIVTGVCAKVYMCMKALRQQGDGVFVHSNKYCCSGQSQS